MATQDSLTYRPRLVDPLLDELLNQLPALLVVGPRTVGKTTALERRAATTIRLDRDAEAAAFEADPDAALRGLAEPVLLDEWQNVPGVLNGSAYVGAVTTAELQYVRAGWATFQPIVQFLKNGAAVGAPW